MAKTLFHSELVKMGPVKMTVKSDVLHSKYSKPNDPKPPYVILDIGGTERTYNCENPSCESFFSGAKNQVITIIAEGSREDATITLVGEELPRRQEPLPKERVPDFGARPPVQPPQQQPPPARPIVHGTVPNDHVTGMRATEVEYSFTKGLPNYCSEKIGIVVALEPGAKAADALAFARQFVHGKIQQSK